MKIEGQGIVAEMCQDLLDIIKPFANFNDVNFNLCLPHPHQPDYSNYVKIGLLITLSWIILILEPYELRFRHIIMEFHYPEISQERAVWLYHEILAKRTSLVKYARQKFFKGGSVGDEALTCLEIFRAKVDR